MILEFLKMILVKPELRFNALIMLLYVGAIIDHSFNGKKVDAVYWLSALVLTICVTIKKG